MTCTSNLFQNFPGELIFISPRHRNVFCTMRCIKIEKKSYKGKVKVNVEDHDWDDNEEDLDDPTYHYFDDKEWGWDMFPQLRFIYALYFEAGGADPITGNILTDNWNEDVIVSFVGGDHLSQNIAYEVLCDAMDENLNSILNASYDNEYGEDEEDDW